MNTIDEANIVFSEYTPFILENGAPKKNPVKKPKSKSKSKSKPAKARGVRSGGNNDFCLKCKQITDNKNMSYKVTANNRNIRSSICQECGTAKTSFITAGEVGVNPVV